MRTIIWLVTFFSSFVATAQTVVESATKLTSAQYVEAKKKCHQDFRDAKTAIEEKYITDRTEVLKLPVAEASRKAREIDQLIQAEMKPSSARHTECLDRLNSNR